MAQGYLVPPNKPTLKIMTIALTSTVSELSSLYSSATTPLYISNVNCSSKSEKETSIKSQFPLHSKNLSIDALLLKMKGHR